MWVYKYRRDLYRENTHTFKYFQTMLLVEVKNMRNIYEIIVNMMTAPNPNYQEECEGIGGVWL